MLVFLSHHFDSAGSSAGSWDIDAAPEDGCSTPKICTMANRQHKGMTTSHDVREAPEVQCAIWQLLFMYLLLRLG